LRAMNRHYDTRYYEDIIGYIRQRIPGCGITSDVMAGFPGETDGDFSQTLDFVRKIKFNNLYMFIYSKREGTAAASMDGQIPAAVKKARIGELIALQRGISAELAKAFVGQTYRALCENGYATTDCGKLVKLSNAAEYRGFGTVRVDFARKGRLEGVKV